MLLREICGWGNSVVVGGDGDVIDDESGVVDVASVDSDPLLCVITAITASAVFMKSNTFFRTGFPASAISSSPGPINSSYAGSM